MEFWGVEVKSGQPLKVTPGENMVLHLSQACLGELKKQKGNESVYLYVTVEGNKLVLGTLLTEKLPQQQFDLVFDTEFEISHNWKSGSVFFYGYMASNGYDEDATVSEGSSDSEEEDIPSVVANNAKPAESVKANDAKDKKSDAVKADAGKQKVKIVEPKKDESSDDDDSMSEDDDLEDSDDDSEDGSDESDEETPQKAEPSKKRAAESATKTPVQDKKAKVTPQKTDGKKVSGHVATPHPAKKADKTPAANKPNQQTPKSGGSVTCKSCNKGFGSEKALESHSKAKHGDGK